MARSHSKPENYHIWCPNIFTFQGGIQVYSFFLVMAMCRSPRQPILDIFLKLDRQIEPSAFPVNTPHFHPTGNLPQKLQTLGFAGYLLLYGASKKPNLAITTHANFAIVAYWLKRLWGTPYWIIAHGIEVWDSDRPQLQTALEYADRILAVSHYTRDRLLNDRNLDPNRVKVLPNTFDREKFQIAPKPSYLLERYDLSANQPTILTVARLDPNEQYKGYDRILQALPTVLSACPDARYILVGKGGDRDRIEQEIQSLKLASHVTLTGFIPDAELRDHYNLCDIFAMPSKGEGFGIVYLEALACGKPSLGGNKDGALDALCHGELGALVDPDNIQEIAQTLIQILQKTYPNPLMYQPEALRQRAIDIYGFERFQQTLDRHLAEFWQENRGGD
ncbi:glycosyltransferase [Roseofilum casamattae]|uniref:Glycosyltransferase n=1 Tax=Roseofilum casamattae BLCC-M143 TaxID=3022442 RepID=A0ABT7C0T7_9CYAN|nr:glycosyltransferase [Roseofilum casamattae]MDJ1185069.1 glycosyltransferase [Roseofilum casamattae BLCC-M143]